VYDSSLCLIGDVILSVNGYGENVLPADGRLVSIATYEAAFQLLGTNFGGDGSTTFGSAGSAGVCATGTAVLHLPGRDFSVTSLADRPE
jgi:microcystin-dependent protein